MSVISSDGQKYMEYVGVMVYQGKVIASAEDHDGHEWISEETIEQFIRTLRDEDALTMLELLQKRFSNEGVSKPLGEDKASSEGSEKLITDKQQKFLKELISELKLDADWPEDRIAALSQKEASIAIGRLKKQRSNGGVEPADSCPATYKQKRYIKTLLNKANNPAEFADVDIDKLDVSEAKKMIGKLVKMTE